MVIINTNNADMTKQYLAKLISPHFLVRGIKQYYLATALKKSLNIQEVHKSLRILDSLILFLIVLKYPIV